MEGFDPHTALEFILFYALPRQDTNELAHRLLDRFGSFSAVLDAPYEELMKVHGVGGRSALLLKLMPAAAAYYRTSKANPGEVLGSSERAGAYFVARFIDKRNEEVWLAAMDDRRKVLRCVCVSEEGTVNAVRITVRRIVTEVVNANATCVVMAHNHPGGIALPSSGDKQMTAQVFQALRMIDVRLDDHIIVAGEDFISLADSGYIERLQPGGR
jgi:DNA repair protein RadC